MHGTACQPVGTRKPLSCRRNSHFLKIFRQDFRQGFGGSKAYSSRSAAYWVLDCFEEFKLCGKLLLLWMPRT